MTLLEQGSQVDLKEIREVRAGESQRVDAHGPAGKLAGHPSIKKKGMANCPYQIFDFFEGTRGVTHYRLEGAVDSELVITFHGLNGTRTTWQGTSKDLVSIGYCVLTYDLFGHGLSENPTPDVFTGYSYTLQFFVDQLEELLVHLKLNQRRCNLLGFSLGALVAVAFACKNTQRILRIAFVAPAGALERKPRSLKAIEACSCMIPCSSRLVCRCCVNKRSFFARCSSEDRASGAADVMWNRVMWNLFEKKRTVQGFLSTVTRLPLWSAEDMYKRIADIPVLLLWGLQDTVIPIHTAEILAEELQNHHLVSFPNATHLLLSEKLNECTALIATFLDFPPNCHLHEYQYLLPFTIQGTYRLPRNRKPDDMSQEDYFDVIGYKPKRWFKVKDNAAAAAALKKSRNRKTERQLEDDSGGGLVEGGGQIMR